MFNRTLLLAFVSLCVSSSALAQGPFLNVTNNCPISVPLYAAGELKTTLTTVSANPSKSFTLFNDTTLMGGYFYTDANQGNKDGNGAVRVSFKENVSEAFRRVPFARRFKRVSLLVGPLLPRERPVLDQRRRVCDA